ncbi:unnamed protein product [Symbiodinium sp. CCMP2456]|nr:unnamed protein product [Symbiodinium sp. CCMP2456]
MSLPATRGDWLRCADLGFFDPTTSYMRSWTTLQNSLQQHLRMFVDDAWPLPVRQARQSLLRGPLSAGWALTEHSGIARTAFYSGDVKVPCSSLQCAQCPLGEITIRSAVLLTAPEDALKTISKTPDSHVMTRNLVTFSLWDMLMKLDTLFFLQDEITWGDIIRSGWPLFAVLAAWSTRISGNKLYLPTNITGQEETWVRQLRDDLARVLRPQSFPDEILSYLGPNDERFQRWVAMTKKPPRRACDPAQLLATILIADGASAMVLPLPADEYLATVQREVKNCRAPMNSFAQLFSWPWPVFEALDWLQTPAEVRVRILPSPLHRRFFFFQGLPEAAGKLCVPRYRRPGTFGFVGDNVRARQQPHCSYVFQNAFDTALEMLPKSFRIHVVDIGPMLGDCCLWSLRRQDVAGASRGQCWAYEANEVWVRLAAASAQLNDLKQAMQVQHGRIAETGQMSLDSLLRQKLSGFTSKDFVALKVHTDGRELGILKGDADSCFRVSGRLKWSCSFEDTTVITMSSPGSRTAKDHPLEVAMCVRR